MKEYTFEEVIANIKVGETYKCIDMNFIINKITKNDTGLDFNSNNVIYNGIRDTQRFIKVETPVSFKDVLNSNKKCRIEHSKINKAWLRLWLDEYQPVNAILYQLVKEFNSDDFSDIVEEGEWHIEQD
jgi:hypothetical protein